MATNTTGGSDWRTGLIIVAAVIAVGALFGGALWMLEVPGGELTAVAGAIVGGILGFLGVSYVMYGR